MDKNLILKLLAEVDDSQGCGCCGDSDAFQIAIEELANMFQVPRHPLNARMIDWRMQWQNQKS